MLMSVKQPRGIGLLLLQPTPFCNLDCSYCYLPNRARKARMPDEVLRAVAQHIVPSSLAPSELSLCWHGGEPLTVPVSWYRDACETLESATRPDQRLIQHVQTNATLIDPEWVEFFRERQIRIGISIDGPRHIHDAHRLTRGGESTFEQTMHGIAQVREAGLEFDVIAVLTNRALAEPDELFDFFAALRPRSLGFNIDEIEGPNLRSSLSVAGVEQRMRRFLDRFFQRHAQAGEPFLLRPLEQLRLAVGGLRQGRAAAFNDQTEPLSIVVVNVDGAMSTFSPELIGHPDPAFGHFVFGDVRDGGPELMLRNSHLKRLQGLIGKGKRRCARTCGYYKVCLGGAPGNKYFETGRFDTDETLFCRLTVKTMVEAALAHMESLCKQH
jgi:uncharacterized protein